MLTISEAQRRAELFLTGQMLEALRAVEYELPSFDTELHAALADRRPADDRGASLNRVLELGRPEYVRLS
jgi:hypothetical protein